MSFVERFLQSRKPLPLALLTAAALSGAPALRARPAECLVVVEGKTLLDGACDFRPDGGGGSFTVTGKGVTASVTVYPDGGMAIYSTKGDSPWKLGDVRRDGACWSNRLGKICSWAPGSRPASAAAATTAARPAAPPPGPPAGRGKPVEGKLFRWDYAKVGDWEIARFSPDPYGKAPGYCTAIVITGSEQAIRIAAYPKSTVYGFMGDASGAIGNAPRISYWFDNRKTERTTVAAKLISSQEEGVEWLTFTQSNNEPGLEDRLMNSRSLHFGYRWDGRDVVQSFPLKGTNAAMKKLFECGRR